MDIDQMTLELKLAEQRRWFKESMEIQSYVRYCDVMESKRIRREKGAPGSKAGGDATAELFAKPELDDLIRGCLARDEPMRVKAWVDDCGTSKSAVYRRIKHIRSE